MTLDECVTIITALFCAVVLLLYIGGWLMLRPLEADDGDGWKAVPEDWRDPEIEDLLR